jgi:UDP-N-acetylglucosamine 3-dehydrogenase
MSRDVRRSTGRKHRVAIVGLGAMGRRHARVVSSLQDRFEVVGVYDEHVDRRSCPGIATLGTEAEAIACSDVIVVATPNAAHAATATRALAAGRHVLVEKPLCALGAEARALEALARGSARLFVGHSERFNPVIRALGRLVRGERVAAIDLLRVGPTRPTGCGVLVNLGVHDLDLAAYLGGGEMTLRGAAGASVSEEPGEDLAHVLLTTAGGAAAHVYVDRTFPEKRRWITLTTACWIYEGDLLAHRLVRTARDTGVRTEVPLPLGEPLLLQAVALADALDGAPSREIATAADGMRAVMLAERAATYCTPAPHAAEKLSVLGPP